VLAGSHYSGTGYKYGNYGTSPEKKTHRFGSFLRTKFFSEVENLEIFLSLHSDIYFECNYYTGSFSRF
jgi:hypothetical protein